jgi:hypothetical protein
MSRLPFAKALRVKSRDPQGYLRPHAREIRTSKEPAGRRRYENRRVGHAELISGAMEVRRGAES